MMADETLGVPLERVKPIVADTASIGFTHVTGGSRVTFANGEAYPAGPIGAEMQLDAQGAGPAFATHVCDVEVDPETRHVKVLRYTAAQDCGRAIHPSYVEGRIQGGVTQGIGWALSEEYIYDKNGRMDNPGFLDYRCPVASDMPMLDAVIGCRKGEIPCGREFFRHSGADGTRIGSTPCAYGSFCCCGSGGALPPVSPGTPNAII